MFQVLVLVIFLSFFLFLTLVIISVLYFTQIKCYFLSVKDHSFVQSFTVSEIVINLPYECHRLITLTPNVHNWAKVKLIFMDMCNIKIFHP